MFHFRKAKRVLPLPTKSATIALFAGFSLVAACGSKKEDPAGKPAPKPGAADSTKQGTNPNAAAASPAGAFLKWSDFDAYALPQGTQTDSNRVLDTLTWESLLYANFPEDNRDPASDSSLTPQEKAEAQAEQKCRDDLDAKGMQIAIENDLIKINFKKKDTCSKEGWYSIETTLSMQCVGSDLSSLKGKSFKELEPMLKVAQEPSGICGKANEFRIFLNQKSESESSYEEMEMRADQGPWQDETSQSTTEKSTNNNLALESVPYAPIPSASPSSYTTTKVVTRTTGIFAKMQPNGAPCVQKRKDNTIVLEGECWDQSASRSTTEYSGQSGRKPTTSVERSTFKSKGIVEPLGTKNVWINAGTIDVTINEWKGTVTASPTSAPRAALTSPSGAMINRLIPTPQELTEELTKESEKILSTEFESSQSNDAQKNN